MTRQRANTSRGAPRIFLSSTRHSSLFIIAAPLPSLITRSTHPPPPCFPFLLHRHPLATFFGKNPPLFSSSAASPMHFLKLLSFTYPPHPAVHFLKRLPYFPSTSAVSPRIFCAADRAASFIPYHLLPSAFPHRVFLSLPLSSPSVLSLSSLFICLCFLDCRRLPFSSRFSPLSSFLVSPFSVPAFLFFLSFFLSPTFFSCISYF